MLLGCIADDFTGASDLANTLAKGGMRTVQFNGIPRAGTEPRLRGGGRGAEDPLDRAADAVGQSLAALEWLRGQGCRQFFFKYCSTFDSTPEGNIGPVAEALLEALERAVRRRLPGLSRDRPHASSWDTSSSARSCSTNPAWKTIRSTR